MRILGFTDLRQRELSAPLEAADYDGRVVAVDPDQSMARRAWEQIRGGRATNATDRPDLVLVYNGSGVLGLVSILFGWYYAVPVLVRVNGDLYRQHSEKVTEHWNRGTYRLALLYVVQAALTRLTYSVADGFLVVSEELKRILHSDTGCPESRIAVVPSPGRGVGSNRTESHSDSTDPCPSVAVESDRLLLTVTNLDFRGKFEGVADVVNDIWRTLPEDVTYVVAGDGVYRERLESHIERTVDDASTRERIHTPGFVDDVDSLYARADVFVYVSYIDGYPNAVLEAQAAALPVVANRAHGMVEQIDEGRTGLLIDPTAESAVSAPVFSLLEDSESRRRLGRRARREVRTRNSPDRVGNAMLDAIEDIVEEAAKIGKRGVQ